MLIAIAIIQKWKLNKNYLPNGVSNRITNDHQNTDEPQKIGSNSKAIS